MQGSPTPEDTVAKFRVAYIYGGNASKAARECNIPESTGRDLAQKLNEDPEFVGLRRKLRAQALDELVAMRQRMAEEASERFFDEHGGIDVKRFGGEDAESVTITDKRHEYGKLILDAEKNAQNLARFDAERDGAIAPQREVNINVVAMKPPDVGG